MSALTAPMTLLDPLALRWLLLVPVLVAGVLWGLMSARRALRRFYADAAVERRIGTASTARRAIKATIALAGLVLLVLAMARPATNPKPEKVDRPGRDAIFLLDVSRSMLAQDLKPNRLERAKLGIRDAVDTAEGDRIGVIAFAGASVLKCPLTTDYSFVRLSLEELSPESVSRGGTAIGDAIRTALQQFFPDGTEPGKDHDPRSRTIFLITDGDDQESGPLEAAKKAADLGVRIVTIGLGSDSAGAPVPAETAVQTGAKYMQYGGKTVMSRMDSQTLAQIAKTTPGGVFLNVGTSNIDFDDVYKRLMRAAPAVSGGAEETIKYTELFQFVLAASLLLLIAEPLIHERTR